MLQNPMHFANVAEFLFGTLAALKFIHTFSLYPSLIRYRLKACAHMIQIRAYSIPYSTGCYIVPVCCLRFI